MERAFSSNRLALFSLDSDSELLANVAVELGVVPIRHEERLFEGGEYKIRALDPVRGRDVYLVQSLYSDSKQSVNDKLVKLLFFIGSLRDAGAARVTLYAPYLCYMRKDRRTQFQDPLSSHYLAQLLEAVGLDRLVVIDVHNVAAFENAFRCQTIHLSAQSLFASYFASLLANENITVVSPDLGGAKRVEQFRVLLSERTGKLVESAFVEKYRSGGVVSGGRMVGDVVGRCVIIMDDLIAGGTTMRRAAEACRDAGAKTIYATATHAVFTVGAEDSLSTPAITRLITTNSVISLANARHQILDIAPLVTNSIKDISNGYI